MSVVSAQTPGVYRFDVFGPNVLAAFSGREFENRHRQNFLNALDIAENKLRRVRQEHTAELVWLGDCHDRGNAQVADALVTTQPDVALGILTADCLPVFLQVSEPPLVGLVHAGWRGLQQRIVARVIERMKSRAGVSSETITVGFGPAIRVCCYEVGEEFRDLFPLYYSARKMDLIRAAKDQLFSEGISEHQIFDSGFCTSCHNKNFFSARKDCGTQERILSIIQRNGSSDVLGKRKAPIKIPG